MNRFFEIVRQNYHLFLAFAIVLAMSGLQKANAQAYPMPQVMCNGTTINQGVYCPNQGGYGSYGGVGYIPQQYGGYVGNNMGQPTAQGYWAVCPLEKRILDGAVAGVTGAIIGAALTDNHRGAGVGAGLGVLSSVSNACRVWVDTTPRQQVSYQQPTQQQPNCHSPKGNHKWFSSKEECDRWDGNN